METPSSLTPAATAPLVPVDTIVPDGNQPRTVFLEASLQELADRIWAQGLLQPITVTPGPDGGPEVIFVGERRFRAFALNRQRAARLLEADPDLPQDHPARWYQAWTAIPALHHPPMPAHLRLIRQIAENDDRNDLTLYERALAMYKALQLSGMTGKALAAEYGVSPTLVSTAKTLVNTKGWTKTALEQGILRSPDAARLFMRIPADFQEALVTQATETESLLTGPMLAMVIDDLERTQEKEKKVGRTTTPGSPPTKPKAAAPSSAPVLSLEALLWLEELLRPESTADPQAQQLAAHAVLHQAIVHNAAFIAILESPDDEHSSPTHDVEEPALQEA
jgi:ParB family transcriptional regulator, chromosome partitioning protein